MTRSAITDVAGVRVGHAADSRLASGVTAVVFDAPAVASVSIGGGAVERVDAFVLSGGSAFGLDAAGGVQAVLRAAGRGLDVGGARVPIVPGAILFDLLNGGDKDWGREPVYWHLGADAASNLGCVVAEGSVGAGLGATAATLKGGLGTASAGTPAGFTVGAIVAVNAIGSATIGGGPHFWAAPYEREAEFGGLGWPMPMPPDALAIVAKGHAPRNTTIGVVVTDAGLTKAEAKRLAIMAQDGLARALRPTHAAFDGDTVFAAATGAAARAASPADLLEIGSLAADCLARAIARGVYHARALPFAGALPAWRDRFG